MPSESIDEEFRPLLHSKALADAKACSIVWARVKGFPAWPAQILSESAASKRLANVTHKKDQDVPIVFFGTLEIAWLAQPDVVLFREGLEQGLWNKCKNKSFHRAMIQVLEFLIPDRKRKSPKYWWCRPPANGHENDDEDTNKAQPKAASAKDGSKGKDADSGEPEQKAKTNKPEAGKGPVAKDASKSSAGAAGGKDAAGPSKRSDMAGSKNATVDAVKRSDGSKHEGANANSAKPSQQAMGNGVKASQQTIGIGIKPSQQGAGNSAKPNQQGNAERPRSVSAPTVRPPPMQRPPPPMPKATGDPEPPRKRIKLEGAEGTSAALAETTGLGLGSPHNRSELLVLHAADILNLPAEIRRLAGIRMVKKPNEKQVLESPQAHRAPSVSSSSCPESSSSEDSEDEDVKPVAASRRRHASSGGRRSADAATKSPAGPVDSVKPEQGGLAGDVQPQQKVRDRKAEKERRIARLAAAKAVTDRRVSSRLAPSVPGSARESPSHSPTRSPAGEAEGGALEAGSDAQGPVHISNRGSSMGAAEGSEDPDTGQQQASNSKGLHVELRRLQGNKPPAAGSRPSAREGLPPVPCPAKAPSPVKTQGADTGPSASGSTGAAAQAAPAAEHACKSSGGAPSSGHADGKLTTFAAEHPAHASSICFVSPPLGSSPQEVPSRSSGSSQRGAIPTAQAPSVAVVQDVAASDLHKLPTKVPEAVLQLPHQQASAFQSHSQSHSQPPLQQPQQLSVRKVPAVMPAKAALSAASNRSASGLPPLAHVESAAAAASTASQGPSTSRCGSLDGSAAAVAVQALGGVTSAGISRRPPLGIAAQQRDSDAPLQRGGATGPNRPTAIELGTDAQLPADAAGPRPMGQAQNPSSSSGQEAAVADAVEDDLEELGEVAAALQAMQGGTGLHMELGLVPAPRGVVPGLGDLPACAPSLSVVTAVPAVEYDGPCTGLLWPMGEPIVPAGDHGFMVPTKWLHNRPPRYETLKRNLWLSKNRPRRLHKTEISICACRAPQVPTPEPEAVVPPPARLGCGTNCLNRLSYVHCDSKLCPCGELCSNRPFHQLRTPRVEIFLTESRGYGVRAMEIIPKGTYIVEYVGEVIGVKELGRRMDHARQNDEPHFYIMEQAHGLYIDARRKGNWARLLNSSCDPNCETQKWHSATTGEVRVGIYALRDIPVGEELTYDYFFEHYGAMKPAAGSFVCKCGAKNCRGTMDVNPERRKDLGRRVELYWDADGVYYKGTVIAYHPASRKHTVMYDDGDKEKVCLDSVAHHWLEEPTPHLTEQQLGTLSREAIFAADSPALDLQASRAASVQVPMPGLGADVLPASGQLLNNRGRTMAEESDMSQHLPLKKRPCMPGALSAAGSSGGANVGQAAKAGFSYAYSQPLVPAAVAAARRERAGDGVAGVGSSGAGVMRRHASGSMDWEHADAMVPRPGQATAPSSLDSLLEAAEAMATLKTSIPAGASPREYLNHQHAGLMHGAQVVPTAKVTSPRHAASAALRTTPPALPPPSSSRGGAHAVPYGNGQVPNGRPYGRDINLHQRGGPPGLGRSDAGPLGMAGSSAGGSSSSGSGCRVSDDILWQFVGIKKPEGPDVLPLFTNGRTSIRADMDPRTRTKEQQQFSHLLRALRESEAMVRAERARLAMGTAAQAAMTINALGSNLQAQALMQAAAAAATAPAGGPRARDSPTAAAAAGGGNGGGGGVRAGSMSPALMSAAPGGAQPGSGPDPGHMQLQHQHQLAAASNWQALQQQQQQQHARSMAQPCPPQQHATARQQHAALHAAQFAQYRPVGHAPHGPAVLPSNGAMHEHAALQLLSMYMHQHGLSTMSMQGNNT